MAQNVVVEGQVRSQNSGEALVGAHLYVGSGQRGVYTDAEGKYSLAISPDDLGKPLICTYIGYKTDSVNLHAGQTQYNFRLVENWQELQELVVSGTLKENSRMASSVAVEVYSNQFFLKNPTPSIFESIGAINGIQPQLNCNVCHTGDIHINGMEGPNTMVLIDGMPIVSGLSTVYGLSGIPNSLVKRIEIIKGPASTLYGSEAVGGVINVITKDHSSTPALYLDVMATSWQELSLDASTRISTPKANGILGVHGYWYNKLHDINGDNFSDIAQQKRISVFNRWDVKRQSGQAFSFALRGLAEQRWGGELQFKPQYAGSDSIYGEIIRTGRIELIGHYGLKIGAENTRLQYSYNIHQQRSYYGTMAYNAIQQIGFVQWLWDKKVGKHELLFGLPVRYTYYDDNSVVTEQLRAGEVENKPMSSVLPGIFAQDDWAIHRNLNLLLGIRYDYHMNHGSIISPRLSLKYQPNRLNTLRLSMGNGYRVVNLFAEDHAALSGARDVVIMESLNPEQSWNVNVNYSTQLNSDKGFVGLDFSAFYTYFNNKITADFDTDPSKIIYENLDGYAVSRGFSANADVYLDFGLKAVIGATILDVFEVNQSVKQRQVYTPVVSGTMNLSYDWAKTGLKFDITARLNGPMRLPVVPNDFRPPFSPWFSIVNFQMSKTFPKGITLYGGLKNMLNFIPKDPILRPFDPFDQNVDDPLNNPNGYTFDPSYMYAPVQGIRAFLGFRLNLSK
jgi:outer membrane receptor for ferrienterochelin and colicins